ncbi:MAG: hypothetical protein J3K34DRAFT_521298 [Monoraphidium minutum]|nr:MAG: hypothetical protein J3K34DRAFT_521298 [Monoraphidium minutum]
MPRPQNSPDRYQYFLEHVAVLIYCPPRPFGPIVKSGRAGASPTSAALSRAIESYYRLIQPSSCGAHRCTMKRPREEAVQEGSESESRSTATPCHSHSFVGVYRTKSGQHWRACIGYGGKLHSVGGRCDDEARAARAYDCAAMLLFGPRAAVNFGAGHAHAFMADLSGDAGMRALEALKAAANGAAAPAAPRAGSAPPQSPAAVPPRACRAQASNTSSGTAAAGSPAAAAAAAREWCGARRASEEPSCLSGSSAAYTATAAAAAAAIGGAPPPAALADAWARITRQCAPSPPPPLPLSHAPSEASCGGAAGGAPGGGAPAPLWWLPALGCGGDALAGALAGAGGAPSQSCQSGGAAEPLWPCDDGRDAVAELYMAWSGDAAALPAGLCAL